MNMLPIALNFEPTEEEYAWMKRAVEDDEEAQNALAEHNILMHIHPHEPKGFVKVVDAYQDQTLVAPIQVGE